MKQGVALENSTSTSQQDLQSYPQQPAPAATSHSPTAGHYIYQQPHSPVPQSPVSMPADEVGRFDNYYIATRECHSALLQVYLDARLSGTSLDLFSH